MQARLAGEADSGRVRPADAELDRSIGTIGRQDRTEEPVGALGADVQAPVLDTDGERRVDVGASDAGADGDGGGVERQAGGGEKDVAGSRRRLLPDRQAEGRGGRTGRGSCQQAAHQLRIAPGPQHQCEPPFDVSGGSERQGERIGQLEAGLVGAERVRRHSEAPVRCSRGRGPQCVERHADVVTVETEPLGQAHQNLYGWVIISLRHGVPGEQFLDGPGQRARREVGGEMLKDTGEVDDEEVPAEVGRAPAVHVAKDAAWIRHERRHTIPPHHLADMLNLEDGGIGGKQRQLEHTEQHADRDGGGDGTTHELDHQKVGQTREELIDDVGGVEVVRRSFECLDHVFHTVNGVGQGGDHSRDGLRQIEVRDVLLAANLDEVVQLRAQHGHVEQGQADVVDTRGQIPSQECEQLPGGLHVTADAIQQAEGPGEVLTDVLHTRRHG